jgi:Tfp pilus assembly protein PilF
MLPKLRRVYYLVCNINFSRTRSIGFTKTDAWTSLAKGGKVDSNHRRSGLTALSASIAVAGICLLARPATPQVPSADPPAVLAATPTPNPTMTGPVQAAQTQTPISAQTPVKAPNPDPLEALSPEQAGDVLMAKQRYQAAIEAYKQGPHDSALLWNKMGIAYQLMLNLDEATHCYERSLHLDSKNATVLNNLGTVYDSLKEYANAERMYHKAIKYDAKSALIYKNLGTNLLSQHKYKKGWEDYKIALAIDPDIFKRSASPKVENPASVEDRGAMNYYMARGCVRAGMNDRAIEYLRMALNEGFTNPKKIMADGEFAVLRGVPAFEQLIASQGTP